ncbi:hypothetical protein ACTFIY_002705 [Dictyostelium cf. discoideum]
MNIKSVLTENMDSLRPGFFNSIKIFFIQDWINMPLQSNIKIRQLASVYQELYRKKERKALAESNVHAVVQQFRREHESTIGPLEQDFLVEFASIWATKEMQLPALLTYFNGKPLKLAEQLGSIGSAANFAWIATQVEELFALDLKNAEDRFIEIYLSYLLLERCAVDVQKEIIPRKKQKESAIKELILFSSPTSFNQSDLADLFTKKGVPYLQKLFPKYNIKSCKHSDRGFIFFDQYTKKIGNFSIETGVFQAIEESDLIAIIGAYGSIELIIFIDCLLAFPVFNNSLAALPKILQESYYFCRAILLNHPFVLLPFLEESSLVELAAIYIKFLGKVGSIERSREVFVLDGLIQYGEKFKASKLNSEIKLQQQTILNRYRLLYEREKLDYETARQQGHLPFDYRSVRKRRIFSVCTIDTYRVFKKGELGFFKSSFAMQLLHMLLFSGDENVKHGAAYCLKALFRWNISAAHTIQALGQEEFPRGSISSAPALREYPLQRVYEHFQDLSILSTLDPQEDFGVTFRELEEQALSSRYAEKKLQEAQEDLEVAQSKRDALARYSIKSDIDGIQAGLENQITEAKTSLNTLETGIITALHAALRFLPESDAQFSSGIRVLPLIADLVVIVSSARAEKEMKRLFPELSETARKGSQGESRGASIAEKTYPGSSESLEWNFCNRG